MCLITKHFHLIWFPFIPLYINKELMKPFWLSLGIPILLAKLVDCILMFLKPLSVIGIHFAWEQCPIASLPYKLITSYEHFTLFVFWLVCCLLQLLWAVHWWLPKLLVVGRALQKLWKSRTSQRKTDTFSSGEMNPLAWRHIQFPPDRQVPLPHLFTWMVL